MRVLIDNKGCDLNVELRGNLSVEELSLVRLLKSMIMTNDKSINALLTIFNNGCCIRIGLFINLYVVNSPKSMKITSNHPSHNKLPPDEGHKVMLAEILRL